MARCLVYSINPCPAEHRLEETMGVLATFIFVTRINLCTSLGFAHSINLSSGTEMISSDIRSIGILKILYKII